MDKKKERNKVTKENFTNRERNKERTTIGNKSIKVTL